MNMPSDTVFGTVFGTLIDTFVEWFAQVQAWLFENLVQVLLFHTGMGDVAEQAFEGTEWFLAGVIELMVLFTLLRPLEAWFPVQTIADGKPRWNDFTYTAIHRLGLFSLLIFFLLDPLLDELAALLHLQGVQTFNLEGLWPDMPPLASFFLYLLVFDFFDYWYHRMQHRFNWWWSLHSLHHSQQYMNLWSDNRNHLLDDVLRDIYMGVIALALGVAPSQYVMLVSLSRCLESLQHANVRLHFGRLGELLLVSPRYHRLHHGIGIGHESSGPGSLGGCNFAVLFPIWDILFRTRDASTAFVATGVRDQLPLLPAGQGRDYGNGFWSQQWLGLCRLGAALRRKKGV